MEPSALHAFYTNAKFQVKTVLRETKVAAGVIFLTGLLTGCVLF